MSTDTKQPGTTDTGQSGATAPSAAGRSGRTAQVWRTAGPVAVTALMIVVVLVSNPRFFSGGGPGILAIQATFILLAALGQSCVLNIGSIDLSNAALAVLAAMILAMTLGSMGPLALVVAIGLSTVIGMVNGFVIAYAQVPSFALTLGTLGILQAASRVSSKATTVYVKGSSDVLTPLFGSAMAGLPTAFWLSVVLAVALWFVTKRTRFGQSMTAVGINETGAIFSGLSNRRVKILAFGISGFFSGVAGVMIIAQGGAASSFGLGSDLLLPGIAAAIVGGTAITGGVTNPLLVVFGALTIALIPIAAAVLGVPASAQSLVYGLVIIVAAALTMQRRSSRTVK
jgi:ribose transport system permease protein